MTDFNAIAQGMTQAVPFAGHLGLEITSITEGEAIVLLPERPELTNHVGSQHAGALFTVAETASGAAFVGAFAERLAEVTPLARSAEISYEKIAKGQIEASAKLGVPAADALATLDAEGKVEFPCEVELADSSGVRVATATVHWHVRLDKPAAAEA
ncbi:MAG TPA: YiiD C-terminal domain-containing protein [Solirubrobacterales bacterium]|nr:YiiD C-terminal domain-containing protein [Solirubrobacterales bacterium]